MKTTLMISMLVLSTAIVTFAQGLNANASMIRKNHPTEYELTIKKHAVQEWEDDFEMVVYEINKQADDLIKLIDEFKSEHTNIAYKAIQRWSIDGYLEKNITEFKKIETFGLKELMKLHCDWSMVKYEYDKQVEAKTSF